MKSFKAFLLLVTLMLIIFFLFSTDLFFSEEPIDREYESALNYTPSFEVGDDSSSSSGGEFTNIRFGTDDVTEDDKSDSVEETDRVNELNETDDTDSSSGEDELTTDINNPSDYNGSDEIVVTTTKRSYNKATDEDIEPNLCMTYENGTSLYYEPNSCTQPDGITCLNKQINLKLNDYPSFKVSCDNNSIIIQRRLNGDEDFNVYWGGYLDGFGDFDGNFWLGLKQIHAITTKGEYELQINMEDFDGRKGYAKYSAFVIDSDYAIKILGKYSGDAGDSLSIHKGEIFNVAQDEDSDETFFQKCKELRSGGWWFFKCRDNNKRSSLNGKYYDADSASDVTDGIYWATFSRTYKSLKYVQMSLQPVS